MQREEIVEETLEGFAEQTGYEETGSRAETPYETCCVGDRRGGMRCEGGGNSSDQI